MNRISTPDKPKYYPNQHDSCAFGMEMGGRSFSTNTSRFGYMGKEKENEISLNDYDFGARIYSGSLGRWLSMDKKTNLQPGWSPYKAFLDNPLLFNDPEGEIEHITITMIDEKSGKSMTYKKTTDNVITMGVVSKSNWLGDYKVNQYFDFNSNIVITRDKNGKVTTSITQTPILDGNKPVKDESIAWINGEKAGHVKELKENLFIEKKGIVVYGDANSSKDSPGSQSDSPWGSFDYSGFMKLINIAYDAMKTKEENSLKDIKSDIDKEMDEMKKKASVQVKGTIQSVGKDGSRTNPIDYHNSTDSAETSNRLKKILPNDKQIVTPKK